MSVASFCQAHNTLFEAKQIALGRDLFPRSRIVEHRRRRSRLTESNPLFVRERRELRLPSVNMSAWIFHSPLLRMVQHHTSLAPLFRIAICIGRHFLHIVINEIYRAYYSHFLSLWNSTLQFFLSLFFSPFYILKDSSKKRERESKKERKIGRGIK